MEALFLLVPVSIVIVGLGAWLFVLAARAAQFDNLDRHGLDILEQPASSRADEHSANKHNANDHNANYKGSGNEHAGS